MLDPKYTYIELINDSKKLKELLSTLANGMNVETNTFRTHDESIKWFRESNKKY
mgnify:CR=1 FL=1